MWKPNTNIELNHGVGVLLCDKSHMSCFEGADRLCFCDLACGAALFCSGMRLCFTENSILAGPFACRHFLNSKPAQPHLTEKLPPPWLPVLVGASLWLCSVWISLCFSAVHVESNETPDCPPLSSSVLYVSVDVLATVQKSLSANLKSCRHCTWPFCLFMHQCVAHPGSHNVVLSAQHVSFAWSKQTSFFFVILFCVWGCKI